MFEKVNPAHPDKIADRIAGAIVDYAYKQQDNPRIAVEVMIGHGHCYIVSETSVIIPNDVLRNILWRITGDTSIRWEYIECHQDEHLAANQEGAIRCGDNGIFKGAPVTWEQKRLTGIAFEIYDKYRTDGKYILDDGRITICQSNATTTELCNMIEKHTEDVAEARVNPLGDWTGGTDVDTGATNRKLGSDMGDSVTGGGLNGKDLSKADVSVNIWAWLKAQETGEPVELSCSIGDETVDGVPYAEIVDTARRYINSIGGFEAFAEWGLIRPF